MISYLRGAIAANFTNTANRAILILEVQRVGYELQILPSFARHLDDHPEEELITIHTHLQVREDQQILYGFGRAAERDLFRQLISVSGIGTQLAIALMDSLAMADLVQAIVTGNTKLLCRAPGVGKKTAERIALELKTKLAKWRQAMGITTECQAADGLGPILEDVEMTLLALGYSQTEIQQAIAGIQSDPLLMKNPEVEEWIRRAITWLGV